MSPPKGVISLFSFPDSTLRKSDLLDDSRVSKNYNEFRDRNTDDINQNDKYSNIDDYGDNDNKINNNNNNINNVNNSNDNDNNNNNNNIYNSNDNNYIIENNSLKNVNSLDSFPLLDVDSPQIGRAHV